MAIRLFGARTKPLLHLAISDSETSGTESITSTTVNVSPVSGSTRVVFGNKVEINFDSPESITQGGWLTAQEKTVNTAGGGTIDKIVGDMVQLNLTGGRVASALCYEAEIATVDAQVDALCGFYFPNLENVPGINSIGMLAAFANQHRRAIIMNAGVYVDGDLRQLAPPAQIGFAPGRYYSAPYRWLGYSTTTPGIADLMPIYIPHRCTIAALGVGVNGSLAGAKGRIALYTAQSGAVGVLKAQTAELDLSTPGAKEGLLNKEIDGGMYWLALNTSLSVNASSHSPQDTGHFAAMFGQSDPLASDTATLRTARIPLGGYGPYPQVAGVVPTYLASDARRHLWLRIT